MTKKINYDIIINDANFETPLHLELTLKKLISEGGKSMSTIPSIPLEIHVNESDILEFETLHDAAFFEGKGFTGRWGPAHLQDSKGKVIRIRVDDNELVLEVEEVDSYREILRLHIVE